MWIGVNRAARVEAKLDAILSLLTALIVGLPGDEEEENEMTQISDAVEALRVSVEAQTTETASAVVAIQGMKAQIADLEARVAEAADVPAAVAAIAEFRAALDKSELTDALVANTPSEPTE
jgi:septal ring factor EnvC (AmiA/AmiB activator)